MIVIMTDGEETRSEEMTKATTKAALDRVRKKGWEVVFLGAEFSKFNDAEGVGRTSSRNMAVSKDQLEGSMRSLAQKSKDYASAQLPTVEFNAQDRAQAKEEDVKQATEIQPLPRVYVGGRGVDRAGPQSRRSAPDEPASGDLLPATGRITSGLLGLALCRGWFCGSCRKAVAPAHQARSVRSRDPVTSRVPVGCHRPGHALCRAHSQISLRMKSKTMRLLALPPRFRS